MYKRQIQERHRHRYEFNNSFKDAYEAAGMKCVGINPESDLVEIEMCIRDSARPVRRSKESRNQLFTVGLVAIAELGLKLSRDGIIPLGRSLNKMCIRDRSDSSVLHR